MRPAVFRLIQLIERRRHLQDTLHRLTENAGQGNEGPSEIK